MTSNNRTGMFTAILAAALAGLLLSCSGSVAPSGMPEVAFALQQIDAAKASSGNENLSVSFALDEGRLGGQEYSISVDAGEVRIAGGDARGLMYGGFEAAEQLELNGAVEASSGKPFLERRGVKFNIPLDARTPSYDDSGDAAQKNIAEMWNWEFWEEYLDTMALNRYNTLTLWNPHPFPSMIKLPDYPEVALDDVYVTTLEPVGEENEWGDPQLVTSNVMASLERVKEISIDEKIAFWQRVMRHAKERGIDIYYITWNICPNSVAQPVPPYYKTFGINLKDEKPGKHGVTHAIDNPITVDYHRKAVKTFLLTYPDIKGLGATAGEHMPQSWAGVNREEWLWNTYGLGILDAKKEQPGRKVDFIHRVWHSDMDQMMEYWGDYPDTFEASFKYARARLYSTPEPPFATEHIEQMRQYGLKSWWNLRNDDIFVYRWGDPDYVRQFLRFLDKDATAGYYVGSDGYVWGREFISKNPELAGELEAKKHWYRFMLWGRLGYDDSLDEAFFTKRLQARYPDTDASALYKTWQTASKIIPAVNRFHWRNWDAEFSVEACIARPKLGGYREVTEFVHNPTLEGSGVLNPAEYAKARTDGTPIEGKTPLDVVNEIRELAKLSIDGAAALRREGAGEELKTLLGDIDAMAHLGQYYAGKIHAAVEVALYRQTEDRQHQSAALAHLEQALEDWKEYARISELHYKPQMLARTNRLDWTALTEEAERDIQIVNDM